MRRIHGMNRMRLTISFYKYLFYEERHKNKEVIYQRCLSIEISEQRLMIKDVATKHPVHSAHLVLDKINKKMYNKIKKVTDKWQERITQKLAYEVAT